jgi:phasin family protein
MANPGLGADWMADFGKAFGDMRAPSVDLETVVAIQRKNIEALTQANQLALEGAQAVLRHQLEIARRSMEEFSEMFTAMFLPNGSMEERVAKQTEFSKSALEKSMTNAREITDLMTKANTEAFNVLSKRVAETLEEMTDLAKKRSNGGV